MRAGADLGRPLDGAVGLLDPCKFMSGRSLRFQSPISVKELYSELFETVVLKCAGNSPFNVILQFEKSG